MAVNAQIIYKHFPNLTDTQKEQISKLGSIYLEWNNQINVISRKDINDLYLKHVLHSLAIAKVIQFKNSTKILDVGTGGGFPGIPLAIFFPKVNFHLIDSIGKKIKVVQDVIHQLKLDNVKAEQIRAEQINDRYDFIISRAVTRMNSFVQWIFKNIAPNNQNALSNGLLCLKGGDLKEEMNEIKYPWKAFEISNYLDESFFDTKKIIHVDLSGK